MSRNYFSLMRRAVGRSPSFVVRRALQELRTEAERYLAPRRARAFRAEDLLSRTGARSIGELWERLLTRPYVAATANIPRARYELLCPGDYRRLEARASDAVSHRVNFLGSGVVELGPEIDWHKDYKSGYRWPPEYARDIDFMNPDRPSDVKFPWELSRLQWLMPVGQLYLLTSDESLASAARRILEHWIRDNPYAGSVNWSCAMEAAMRIVTWTWFFHVFAKSTAWADEAFRRSFLSSVYLHADFVDRHFEYSDINGNHCDADAAGLVFAGLFFGEGDEPRRWGNRGWEVLTTEIQRQVSEDGVDFEGSVPYHRLVTELFFLPAFYRSKSGHSVPDNYRARLLSMGRFTEAYTRPDGSAPCWGDADDGRVFAFGGQQINDHRYLLGWLGKGLAHHTLHMPQSTDLTEYVWMFGVDAETLPKRHLYSHTPVRSLVFADGGYAVLRNERDHVFVDCASVGMGGRGGHGHNDVLSFEAFLDGQYIVSDRGVFVYTANYDARNDFRSTSAHNTPRIDGKEVNRFVRPDELWWLRDDAKPQILDFQSTEEEDVFVASHSGYARLGHPITAVRTYRLKHATHALSITDNFEGVGVHHFEIPIHLGIGVIATSLPRGILLTREHATFLVTHSPTDWNVQIEMTEISPSYGTKHVGNRIVWRRSGQAESLRVDITPTHSAAEGEWKTP